MYLKAQSWEAAQWQESPLNTSGFWELKRRAGHENFAECRIESITKIDQFHTGNCSKNL